VTQKPQQQRRDRAQSDTTARLTRWVPYGTVGLLLAASSSDRLEKVLVRGGTSRLVGGASPEAQASLPVFLPALVLAAVVYMALVFLLCVVVKRTSSRVVNVVLIVVVLAACVAFFVVYPRLGLPQSTSGFGDEDDAINILIGGLLEGRNPYTVLTYIGNPVSPLMGSALVGAPFYLLFGSAGYQNPFLLALLIAACWKWLGPRVTLVTTIAAFSSAGFTEYFLVGGDYFLISACVAGCSFLYLSRVSRGDGVIWSSSLLAIAGCTRMSFLVAALVAVGVALLDRGRNAVIGGALVGGISVALVIPWLLATGYNLFFPLQAARLLGPIYFQILSGGLVALTVLYVLARRKIELCYLVGLSAAPVLFVDPGQLFRISSFVWWGLPLFAASVGLIAERFTRRRESALTSRGLEQR
jgi:hypothetical protein